jgi:hypothetical protein
MPDPMDIVTPLLDEPRTRTDATSVKAMDVVDLEGESEELATPMVIDSLLGEKEIIAVTGEEGDGKTTMVDQLLRQMLRGDDVFDFFTVGELRPRVVLFVDTHQEEPEIRRRAKDMRGRNLGVERGQLYWWCAGGKDLLNDPADRAELDAILEQTGAEFVWVDAGGHLVNDPKDDVEVTAFFEWLSNMMREHDLRSVGLTLFPRKRAAGDYARKFDDLFGSREWKGRLTTALYIEANKVTCWKDRASYLRKVWTPKGLVSTAILHRPGLADASSIPFSITVGEPEEEQDRDALKAKALSIVEGTPGVYTKTDLAGALGKNSSASHAVVAELIRSGTVGPQKRGAKLRVQEPSLLEPPTP